jgi:hypothetical protein
MAFAALKAAFILGFFLAINLCARSVRAEILIEPHVGFHGVFQLGQPFPLDVELSNAGPAVEGKLEVQVWKSGGSKTGAMYPLSYRRDVFLSAQSRKNLQFTIDPDFLSRPLKITFTNSTGAVSRELDLRHYFSPAPVLLLLSEGDTAARISLGPSTRNRLIALTMAELPADARALLGVSHLILYDQSLRDLSRYQFLALDRWLIAGGRMIILGSFNYALYQEPTISRFLPVHVTGMKKIALLPSLTHDQGVSPIADVWVQTSRVIRGNVLVQAQGIPILVEASRGKGKITYLAPDVGRPPVSRWDGFSSLLRALLAPGTDAYLSHGAIGTRWDDAVFSQVISNPSFISVYVPTASLFFAIVGYLTGIGIFAWLWKRRREKVGLVTLSLTAYVLFAGVGGYLFFDRGGNLPDGILLSSTVLDTIADGYVEAQSNVALFSTQLRQYELQVKRGWLNWVPISPASRKPRERPIVLQDGSGAGRFQIPLHEWDHRLFKVRFVERFPFRVQFEQKSDRVFLKIDNQTRKDLTDCFLVAAGRRYALGTIPSGARWAKEFPLALQAPQDEKALRSTPAASLRDVTFNDKTRDILFHSSLFSTSDGALLSTGDVAIFFGWVKDSQPRVWVDHAGIWAYDYTLFRTILPLNTGEDA